MWICLTSAVNTLRLWLMRDRPKSAILAVPFLRGKWESITFHCVHSPERFLGNHIRFKFISLHTGYRKTSVRSAENSWETSLHQACDKLTQTSKFFKLPWYYLNFTCVRVGSQIISSDMGKLAWPDSGIIHWVEIHIRSHFFAWYIAACCLSPKKSSTFVVQLRGLSETTEILN